MSPPAHPSDPLAPDVAEIDRLLGLGAPAGATAAPIESGRLEETDLELLIGRAFVRAFSGRLALDGPEGEAAIFFEGGRPVDVVVGQPTPAMRASATPASAERALLSLCAAGQGKWTLVPAPPELLHRVLVLRHPAILVNEAIARRKSIERVARWRGYDTNRFALVQPAAADLLTEVGPTCWTPQLRVALRLFDGGRAFRDVVKGSQQSPVDVLRAAYVLFCFGALAPAGDRAAETAAPPPLDRDGARIEALFRLAEASDYFTFLGVDRDASPTEIRAAADHLAREIDAGPHPDVLATTGRHRALIAAVLAEARRILGDPALRADYQAARAREDARAAPPAKP